MDDGQRALEFVKLYYDYSKHQTTLSATTAVVLVALFRGGTPWVALLLLAVSAILSLRVMATLLDHLGNTSGEVEKNAGRSLVSLTNVSWATWIAAIVWAVVAVASGG